MKILTREYLTGLLGVFMSAAFCVYSWSLIIFFWDIPSFLMRLSVSDIIAYAAYQFMFSLAESIIITVFIGFLGLILPVPSLRSNIKVSGTALILAFAVNSILFKELSVLVRKVESVFSLSSLTATQILIGIWVFSLITLPIGLVMATKNERIKQGINNFVNNLSVLISLYLIMSLTGILLIIIRNYF